MMVKNRIYWARSALNAITYHFGRGWTTNKVGLGSFSVMFDSTRKWVTMVDFVSG